MVELDIPTHLVVDEEKVKKYLLAFAKDVGVGIYSNFSLLEINKNILLLKDEKKEKVHKTYSEYIIGADGAMSKVDKLSKINKDNDFFIAIFSPSASRFRRIKRIYDQVGGQAK